MTLDEKNLPVKEFKVIFNFDTIDMERISLLYPNAWEKVVPWAGIKLHEFEVDYFKLRHFFDKEGVHISVFSVPVGAGTKFNYTIRDNYSGEVYNTRQETEYEAIWAAFEILQSKLIGG